MTLIQAIFYANPDRYPPIINGARLLAQAGFNMEIFSRDTGENCDIAYPQEVKVHRICSTATNSKLQYLQFVRQVMRLAQMKETIWLAHDMHGLLPGRLLASLHKTRLVYQSHELVDKTVRLPLGMKFVRLFHQRFARTADLIIAPDVDRGSIMKRELQLHIDPLIVPNAPLQRVPSSGARLKTALAVRGHFFEKIVLRQSSIGPSHGIESTIRSLVHWANPLWGFVVMGPGNADYLSSLRKLAEEIGVAERFVVLPPVSYDEVLDFTPGADVGHSLYTSIDLNNHFSTTASNKLLEYMAAGLPLLVSDRPPTRALVEAHRCGVVADDSSPQSIAAAINFLLGDRVRASEMGRAAARAFETRFRFEVQFQPVIEALERLSH